MTAPRVPSTTANWWQYSRWVRNIARNARITYPTGAELTAFRTFIKVFCDTTTPSAITGTRPWMFAIIQRHMISGANDYDGTVNVEPAYVLSKIVDRIGRDMKKIAPTDAEIAAADTLIAATGTRRLGAGPKFGGTSGSILS